jgi:hypothetical protein
LIATDATHRNGDIRANAEVGFVRAATALRQQAPSLWPGSAPRQRGVVYRVALHADFESESQPTDDHCAQYPHAE